MEENDIPIMSNDISSKLTGVNKDETSQKKKLFLIVGIISVVIIITLIIIIVVSLTGKNSSDDTKIGEITCIYEINTITQKVEILGKDFSKNTKFDIFINGKSVKYSKSIKFDAFGEQEVKFIIYGDLEMENMFKDVTSLISVNMTSEKNAKILSISSAFEGCYYLKEFSLNGFDTSTITSFSKLFYKTSISEIDLTSFNTNKLKDISYMLSTTKINTIDFTGFNSNNVEDMYLKDAFH